MVIYLIITHRSPCHNGTVPRKPAVASATPKRRNYCDTATVAAKFQMNAVKINPLMAYSSQDIDDGAHAVPSSELSRRENPVFYGQRTKIRKTKEQEMISALLEVADGNYIQV